MIKKLNGHTYAWLLRHPNFGGGWYPKLLEAAQLREAAKKTEVNA